MAEIIHDIQECCVKFDQHRPHFKVLSNQYASVLPPPPPPPRLVSSSEEAIFFQNTEFAIFHAHKKSVLKARATSM